MGRERGDTTRYGFPPQRDPYEPFPREIPWDTPISDISGFWLHIEGAKSTTEYPLRLMAAQRGWNVTLREIVPRLKDEHGPPLRVLLTDNGTVDFRRSRKPEGRFLVLLGTAPEIIEDT